ncbi:vitellogenin [Diachasma alloeum]|uniref:vitellogenin n=1 Tax=Diachasma alloeum TaxID=454923 RepID=UPI00073818F1|nr:vitellogenin [Diachasma alloeum]
MHLNIVKLIKLKHSSYYIDGINMSLSIVALLLAGVATADHNNAWNTQNEYHYNLESRSLGGLPEVSDQYSGILLRGVLKIQPKNEKTLLAKLSKVEISPIHTQLPYGWDSEIPESALERTPLITSGKPFTIKLETGIIKELIFDKDVPTWEVNLHKSALSQLQIDTQGENMIPSKSNQPPSDEKSSNAMFKAMEDSIGGNCEVLYDINPLPKPLAEQRLYHLPGKQFRSAGEMFEIMKTKDYEKCEQRVAVHFGIPGSFDFEPASTKDGDFLSKSSISEVILTGNLKTFTVHSSVTTEKVLLSPNLHDSKSGVVASKVNLTLSLVRPMSNPWPSPLNSESVGNLVYTYEQPFSPEGEDRNLGESTMNQSWKNQELEGENNSEEKPHEHHFDDSSSSEESENNGPHRKELYVEKKYYLQPKPTLNEPPQYPILPLFIGNKGKVLRGSDNKELVNKAKKLASEIGRDVEDPNSIPQEQTLEKFTTLIAVLRTMNTQQLMEVQKELHQISKDPDEDDEEQKTKNNAWKAFRDAVASAGTGPALVLVTKMIKEKKLDALEIMNVVSTLPKTAKEPTPEYVNAFFKLAGELESRREDDPKGASTQEALKNDAISTSAILAFTELLRYVQVNHRTAHNRYPVHAFGSFSPNTNDALFRDYLPYLVEKLEQGIEENTARATVYIRALGNVAHPKIIAVFEPYLEGKKLSTVLQRQMMLIALDKLINHYPKAVQGLTYRIYQNTGESFKVRALAVYLLLKTKPNLAMLQRVAQFTNYDVSKHVNGIVKSFIENCAELDHKEYEELARDARMASAFLTPENYGGEYSAGHIIDNYLKELNIHYIAEVGWIYGEDSAMPQGIYTSFNTIYGGFKVPQDETGIMVSSVKDFYKTLKHLLKNVLGEKNDQVESKTAETASEAIVEMLDIEGKKKDKFEFYFLSRDKYSSSYFVIGEDMLHPIPKEYIKKAAESLKAGKNFDLMSLQNFEVTVGLPTATGLPFTFDFQIPRLRKLSGKVQATTSPDISQESTAGPEKVNTATDIRAVFSQKVQSRFRFVTPFDGQQYVTGIDKNLQFHLPMSIQANYDISKNQLSVKIASLNKNEQSKLFHFSTVPFTSLCDVEDFKPLSSEDHSGKSVMNRDVEDSTNVVGKKTRGMLFKITESKPDGSPSALEKIIDPEIELEHIMFPLAKKEVEYYKIEVLDVPSPSSKQEIDLVIGWDSMLKNKPTDSQLSKDSHRWSSNPEVIEPSDKKPGSLSRKKQMMQEALKDLPVADAAAVDFAVELPGEEAKTYLMTTAVAKSKVDGKFKALVYVRTDDVATRSRPFEACATVHGSSPRLPPFEANKIKREELKRSLDIRISVGNSCKSGTKSDLHARQWQSSEFREFVEKDKKMYEAWGVPITFMDKASLVVHESKSDVEDQWMNHPKNTKRLDLSKNKALNKFMANHDSDSNSEDEAYVRLDVDVKPNTKKARFDLTAPMMDFDYKYENELPWSMVPLLSAQGEETYEDRDLKAIGNRESTHRLSSPEGVCVLEKDYVNTFDGAEYPLNMNQCWYLAVTSAPEKESKVSKPAIRSDKQASITIRKDESDELKRQISLSLGHEEIQLSKPDSEVQVKLNRKLVDLSSGVYFDKEGEEDELEIIKLSDEAVRVKSKKFGLKITFDGHRAQIKVDDKYRDSVRGLCGNFDSEPSNDFLTPRNRLSSKPQDFTSLYILPVKECQSTSKNLREAEKSLPLDKPRLNNVVSDREAGRTTHQGKWGSSDTPSVRDNRKHNTIVRTKIFPTDGKTCFSLRPLPTCAPGALPARVKSVLFPVYCLPNGESAKRLSDRIHRGANPDLSQKSPSMKVKLEIAEHCSPAA